jgi:hypothetical protein
MAGYNVEVGPAYRPGPKLAHNPGEGLYHMQQEGSHHGGIK